MSLLDLSKSEFFILWTNKRREVYNTILNDETNTLFLMPNNIPYEEKIKLFDTFIECNNDIDLNKLYLVYEPKYNIDYKFMIQHFNHVNAFYAYEGNFRRAKMIVITRENPDYTRINERIINKV
jgi:hypothetical protein